MLERMWLVCKCCHRVGGDTPSPCFTP